MLHKSKGKYHWQNKATYCVSWSLSPIILAYLKQLLKNKDSDGFGVPQYFCNKQAEIQGLGNWHEECAKEDSKFDLDAAHKLHIEALEELVWAFQSDANDEEPDPEDFGLSYNFTDSKIQVNQERPTSKQEYASACESLYNRKNEAFKLFGEIYKGGLDW